VAENVKGLAAQERQQLLTTQQRDDPSSPDESFWMR